MPGQWRSSAASSRLTCVVSRTSINLNIRQRGLYADVAPFSASIHRSRPITDDILIAKRLSDLGHNFVDLVAVPRHEMESTGTPCKFLQKPKALAFLLQLDRFLIQRRRV